MNTWDQCTKFYTIRHDQNTLTHEQGPKLMYLKSNRRFVYNLSQLNSRTTWMIALRPKLLKAKHFDLCVENLSNEPNLCVRKLNPKDAWN